MISSFPTIHARFFIVLLTILGSMSVPAMVRSQDVAWKYPIAIVAAPSGEIYVADRQLPGIWRLADGKVTSFTGQRRNSVLRSMRFAAWRLTTTVNCLPVTVPPVRFTGLMSREKNRYRSHQVESESPWELPLTPTVTCW